MGYLKRVFMFALMGTFAIQSCGDDRNTNKSESREKNTEEPGPRVNIVDEDGETIAAEKNELSVAEQICGCGERFILPLSDEASLPEIKTARQSFAECTDLPKSDMVDLEMDKNEVKIIMESVCPKLQIKIDNLKNRVRK